MLEQKENKGAARLLVAGLVEKRDEHGRNGDVSS